MGRLLFTLMVILHIVTSFGCSRAEDARRKAVAENLK